MHALDDVERVLALPHDDDAADGVADAVEVGDAAADVGADRHLRHVPHQDRRARLRRRPDDDALDVVDRLHVAAAAHHVLGAGELEQPPADLVVALADRVDHVGERDVVGEQPVRVDVDLVLLDEAADRRHLGDAGHGLQLVAQVPVLQAAQLAPGRAGRCVSTSAYW